MSATGESVKRVTDFGFHPAWSPDGREIVVSLGGFLTPTELGSRTYGLSAVDVATRQRRVVVSVGGSITGRSVDLTRDDKWITYTETGTEGDIWIATLKKEK